MKVKNRDQEPTPEQIKAYREMQQDNWNFFEKDSKKKEEKPL
jgi:hypothetical protein